MRGVSLPVNTIIIISLAILVLSTIIYFFVSGISFFKTTDYEQAFNEGCRIYKERGTLPSDINLGDVNNDGSDDNLLFVCREYFSDRTMDNTDCKNQCDKRFPG